MINENNASASLLAKLRTHIGTGGARALRKEKMVPAIIYANGKENIAVAVEEKEIMKLYHKTRLTSTVIELDIEGDKHKVLVKAFSMHPVTDIINHVDFVFLGEKTHKLDLPIKFDGKDRSPGIKRGGYFNIIKRKIPVECDSSFVPLEVAIDVSHMYAGNSLKAKDITLPSGCKLLCSTETVVASLIGNKGAKAEGEQPAAAK